MHVSRCHKNTDGGRNVSGYHKNTDGGPNIVDLATHMAKYQPVLTKLQVRVKHVLLKLGLGLKVQRIAWGWLARRQLRRLHLRQAKTPYLNTAPDTTGNARGSNENCESQSELNHVRGGGRETQDGK